MSKFSSRFTFIGTPLIPKSTSKRQLLQSYKEDTVLSLFFGIKASENNCGFVEAVGSIQNEIYSKRKGDNEDITVAWEDRSNPDVLEDIAGYRKQVVDLGESHGGRCEFLSRYDMIRHLAKHLPQVKDRVMVTGEFKKEWYKDNFYDHFYIQNVYLAPEERKNRLSLSMDVYYNKDSIDKSDYGNSHKLYLNGYVSQYVNKDVGTKYFSHQFVLCTEKYDKSNPRHQEILAYKLGYLDVKSTSMVHIPWETVLIRGAEEVPFDESMLTDAQKQQIHLGIKTLEDFKPRGQLFGDNINEYRLFDPILRGDFSDGLVDTGLSVQEFEGLLFSPMVATDDIALDISEEDLF